MKRRGFYEGGLGTGEPAVDCGDLVSCSFGPSVKEPGCNPSSTAALVRQIIRFRSPSGSHGQRGSAVPQPPPQKPAPNQAASESSNIRPLHAQTARSRPIRTSDLVSADRTSDLLDGYRRQAAALASHLNKVIRWIGP